jgi:Haem-binding uptake, Tiki superfamily, ChaN
MDAAHHLIRKPPTPRLLPTCHNCGAMVFLRRRRILALTLGCLSCLNRAAGDDQAPFDAVDLNASAVLDKVAAQLASKRVVFIGEIHDRYDHRLYQLEIIRRLRELDPDMAIGVEYLPADVSAAIGRLHRGADHRRRIPRRFSTLELPRMDRWINRLLDHLRRTLRHDQIWE